MGYKIQLILMPAVAFFITTTSKSLILAVGYQSF
ncbi:putative membrane protein, partial [Escherichia coli 2788150]